MKKCRVCLQKFFSKPLLEYKNMPKVAQYLPEAKSLRKDKGVDLKVWQCSSCGLVQLSNSPVPYYREVIRAASISDEMKNFRTKQFKNFVKKYSLKGKKVIEIGCGGGEYLEIMKKCGVEAYGLEYSTELVKKCLKNKLNITRGFIENNHYRIKSSPFDAFFILNFLEHLPEPNSVLQGIASNLSIGAVGLVEVPNSEIIFQKNLFSEFTRDHLFYFTKDTLEMVLKLNGFEILSCDIIWHDYSISAIVRKREKLDISRFSRYQENLKNEINQYIGKFGRKKVAIWGAGHQALAVISMTKITHKIKYVLDSAPFKQGKFTPVTHIPIVSPEKLNSDPVEAIIVMAASYSDEVAKVIHQKYDKNLNVVILRDFGLEDYHG
jgi:SAM-dependent methyltransferase